MKQSNSPSRKNIIIAACVIVALLIAGAIIAGVVLNSQKQDHEITDQKQENTLSGSKEDVYEIASIIELAYNNSDPEIMASRSSAIALVTVKSIDGTSNYGEGAQQYVYPYTYGQMEVVRTFSGDALEEGSIVKFSRLGGTMSFDEYLKGLSETEQAKFANVNPDNKDVRISAMDDIDIEVGKTYLVYLVNSTIHYAEPGAYEIIGYEGGLREIQTSSTGYSVNSNSSDLKVLDNFTGEWENLSDVVKQDK